jgi:hypothetical protein
MHQPILKPLAALFLLTSSPALAQPAPPTTLRVATFNASLNRDTPGQLLKDLSTPNDPQIKAVAEVIQRTRPAILLLNEFDYIPATPGQPSAAELFNQDYLAIPQAPGLAPISYPHHFTAPVNTGLPTGQDLNRDGQISTTPGDRTYGNDSHGFGQFPGQYGMLLLSQYPIDTQNTRTFQNLLWNSMPSALLPTVPNTNEPWYTPETLALLRLSSKSHWDVPVTTPLGTIHILASHPTPPAFDGPEDRNGKRNHDEIRFWVDYLTGGDAANYITDDAGKSGPLPPTAAFVLMGDLNADPNDPPPIPSAVPTPKDSIRALLTHPRVNTTLTPTSPGAAEASTLQPGNESHTGPSNQDTADFTDPTPRRPENPGNLRVDYALPSSNLTLKDAQIFWPPTTEETSRLVKMNPATTSDHRMVYIDITSQR